MPITQVYTIAADADQFGYNRSRRSPVANSIWKIESAESLGFGSYESNQDRDKWRFFVRYPLDIPDGSVIASAYLTLTARFIAGGSFDALIYLADYDSVGDVDALWPGRAPRAEEELSLIDMAAAPAPVTWSLPAEGWVVGAENDTPDIAMLVQGFIDRGSYAVGNYIGFIVHEGDATGTDSRRYAEDETGTLPVLTVVYEPPLGTNFSAVARSGFAAPGKQVKNAPPATDDYLN